MKRTIRRRFTLKFSKIMKPVAFSVVAVLLAIPYPGLRLTPVVPTEVLADTIEGYDVSKPHAIINQVYGGAADGCVSHSFIELYNPTDEDINMENGNGGGTRCIINPLKQGRNGRS